MLSSAVDTGEGLSVAVCQMEATHDVAGNLATIEQLVAQARVHGARLALLPEAALLPIHASADELQAFAASFDETRSALADIAAQAQVAIVVGTFEPSETPGKVFNTVVAHAADGAELGTYRKIHLYDAFGTRESDRFAPGPIAPLTFTLEGFTLGVLTCYDLRFGELARMLVDAGAQALLVPAAWASGPLKEDHWTVLLRARAIESTAYVLAAGQCGRRCAGLSAVIDPLGVVLAGVAEEPGVAVATMRRARVDDVRRRLPALANRRLTGPAPAAYMDA